VYFVGGTKASFYCILRGRFGLSIRLTKAKPIVAKGFERHINVKRYPQLELISIVRRSSLFRARTWHCYKACVSRRTHEREWAFEEKCLWVKCSPSWGV